MQRSTDRIRTTHVGSLPRPPALLDLMKATAQGRAVDPAELAETERRAVADVVARQRSAGLDVISDGEQTKTGFFAYIGQRLSGSSRGQVATHWIRSGPRSTVSPSTTSSTSKAR
jgi:5-methyltetrahydropteroyltriglutamate--homocysteine methyltransferase